MRLFFYHNHLLGGLEASVLLLYACWNDLQWPRISGDLDSANDQTSDSSFHWVYLDFRLQISQVLLEELKSLRVVSLGLFSYRNVSRKIRRINFVSLSLLY